MSGSTSAVDFHGRVAALPTDGGLFGLGNKQQKGKRCKNKHGMRMFHETSQRPRDFSVPPNANLRYDVEMQECTTD